MKLEIVNSAIVLLAKEYNPAVVNPEFLKIKKIVPDEWKPEANPIATPLLSLINYDSAINIYLDRNKLQILDGNPPQEITTSQAPVIARKMLKELPSRFTTVGINFLGFIEHTDAMLFIQEKFIRSEIWNSKRPMPSSMSVNFLYEIEGITLRLNCDNGSIKPPHNKSERNGILISGNYEMKIPENLPLDEIWKTTNDVIRQYKRRANHFSKFIPLLLDLEQN